MEKGIRCVILCWRIQCTSWFWSHFLSYYPVVLSMLRKGNTTEYFPQENNQFHSKICQKRPKNSTQCQRCYVAIACWEIAFRTYCFGSNWDSVGRTKWIPQGSKYNRTHFLNNRFVDLHKAYDCVDQTDPFTRLLEKGITGKFFKA